MKLSWSSKFIATLGIGLAAYGVWGIYERFKPANKSTTVIESTSQDWEIINSKDIKDQLFWPSLERLARKQDQRITNIIMPLLSSERAWDQGRAFEIIGYLPDFELGLDAFRRCLNDDVNKRLKISCLKGLGRVPSEARVNLIKNWLVKEQNQSSLYWLGIESLYACLKVDSERAKLIDEASSWVKANINKDVEVPFQFLARVRGHDQNLELLAVNIFENNTHQTSVMAAAYYLAQVENTMVFAKLPQWLDSKNESRTTFVIQVLPILCPPERLKLVDSILSDNKYQGWLYDVLVALQRLGEGGAIPVLEKNLMNAHWTPIQKEKMEELIAELKKGIPPEAQSCRGRKSF